MSLVSFDLCEGNPGALAFMGEAYRYAPFKAESGFARMRDNGISGAKLYMLWNDCCDRNTAKAVDVMRSIDIEEIIRHINYGGGRGTPFSDDKIIRDGVLVLDDLVDE